jgi:hypothetical protein
MLRNGVINAICCDEMPQTNSVDNKWQENGDKHLRYLGQNLPVILSEKSKAKSYFYPWTAMNIEVLHFMCV